MGALGRQVGPGFGGKAGKAGRGRLILAQGRPPRAALDAKLALERRFREPLDIKLALVLVARQAGQAGQALKGCLQGSFKFLEFLEFHEI